MSEIYSIEAKWTLGPNNETLKDQQILVEDKKIVYIGKFDGSKTPQGTERLKFPKSLVCPPFINAHTHIPETLVRGLIDDVDLKEWLFNHVWKVEPMMKAEDARVGAQLGVAEMIKSGTIGFNDQYFYSDQIAQVVYESGVKAFLAPSIFGEFNPESKTVDDAFNKSLEVIKKWHKKDDRIFVGFGPHAAYTVTEEMFLRIYEQAEKNDTYIHTHVNESRREVDEAFENNGESAVQTFDRLGILDRIFAAHCVHLDEKDIELLLKYKVPILHNLQSNLKIGSGIAPIPEYLDRGLQVMVGTDGNASNNNLDMLEEIRLIALLHKGIHQDPKLIDAKTALNMGTRNASVLFPKGVYSGILDEGHPADLIIVDQNRINMSPVINPFSNWIFSANASNVCFTMCNGKVLYNDGILTTLNEEKIIEAAQKSTDRMMSEANYSPVEFTD